MMAGILEGVRAAAPEVGGLLLTVLLVLLAYRACEAWDRAADGRVIGVRWRGRLDDADGQMAELKSMIVRSRRAGVR